MKSRTKVPFSRERSFVLLVAAVSLGFAFPHRVSATEEAHLSIDPAAANRVEFDSVSARFVRFVIHSSWRNEPCLDELEVYGADPKVNLALANGGAEATASSCLPGYTSHRIEHLNDGKYGNDHSWISAGGTGWAQIRLREPALIQRVVFSRDRAGRYDDRIPRRFEIQISSDGTHWTSVTGVIHSAVVQTEPRLLPPNRAIPLDFPPQKARFVRLNIDRSNGGAPCIDELEIYGRDKKKNLALATRGATPSASSCLEGYPIHQIMHLNDGELSNAHSWIAATAKGWAQIELARSETIQRVVFSRDRGGTYRDRMPSDFQVQLSLDGRHWTTVIKIIPLEGIPLDRMASGESPRDWAHRVASQLPHAWRPTWEPFVDRVQAAADVQPLLDLHDLDRRRRDMLSRLDWEYNPDAIERAIRDLTESFPRRYQPPENWMAELQRSRRELPEWTAALRTGGVNRVREALLTSRKLLAWQRKALLANPLLDFEEIFTLRRATPSRNESHPYWNWGQKYGMTVNWSCDFRPKNPPVADWWDDSMIALSVTDAEREVRSIFEAPATHMIQHPELRFDAKRLLFSMPGEDGAFQVFEVNVDGSGLRRLTTDTEPDIDNGDPCYLPDGRIVFNSTRGFIGVPCEDGESYVSNLCIMDGDGRDTRMLTFDQESNWYPALLNNGRVLYTRYEYANVSHQFGRLLFHMNPDGTGQVEYYGSNSYWPNSIFYARPIPDHPTKVIGVVCGHHGPNRTGRLVILDPARGRRETEGAIQTIPGYGQPVERIVADELYGSVWPKFVHPWPLSEKYFLVSARLHAGQAQYGIYLVDIFDNITQVGQLPGNSLFEPIPLRPRERPPAIPDQVQPGAKDATIHLVDVYRGKAMQGVPRGTIKQLRLFTYNYLYRHTLRRGFGHLATPGVDGPWEPRFILGTVPVHSDGSALFKVPANTPIAVQPLDAEGRAVQLMRSWYTAMPGERFTCVGCHEDQNAAPPSVASEALAEPAANIAAWRGPPRGFDFELEVQPVLDRYCVGCHDGSVSGRADFARKDPAEKARINGDYHRVTESNITTEYTPSFIALHPYVRRPHAESNYRPQVPAEYAADTSPLVQLLAKGHHGVQLDAEAWDRLGTWIDLGAPDHGSWKNSEWGVTADFYERRLEMLERYADRRVDVEWLPPPGETLAFTKPGAELPEVSQVCPDWPFDAVEAQRRQRAVGLPRTLEIEVGGGASLEFVLIPAGEFVMGASDGPGDERAVARVKIERSFYLGRHEVTNQQFAALGDADHFSGHVGWRSIDWRGEGYALDERRQPAVRVSWQQAMDFCDGLSKRTGRRITLPTEAQWEWACRAGSAAPLWYGTMEDDFSACENLAGREQRGFAFHGKRKWYLRDDRYDDGALISTDVGSYAPNPWGLHDMAGNVCEWTRTLYRPYPYDSRDGRNDLDESGDRVVRGGSWYVRPCDARSSYRWKYPPWRRVHNVGFRLAFSVDSH